MSEGSQYELFERAKINDLKRVRELLDAGVDVNLVDYDNGNTALHYACSNGAKQTMELLIQRGANVNATNDRGLTPLHMLITKRYDALALWLVRHGADLHITDKRGYSPRDLALSWFQRELDDAAAGKMTKAEELMDQKEEEKNKFLQQEAAKAVDAKPVLQDEIMRVFAVNGSYKSIRITPTMTAQDLAKVMAEKLNMPNDYHYFEVFENKKGQQRKLIPGENLFEVKSKWPMILSSTGGNETMAHCHFLVKCSQAAPAGVLTRYTNAIK